MSFSRLAKFVVVACLFTIVPDSFPAEPEPLKAELAEATTWFDGLGWPDVRGKPYVEITVGKVETVGMHFAGLKVRGFLIAEDGEAYTVFGDGTRASIGSYSGTMWPFVLQRVRKAAPDERPEKQTVKEVLELPAVVEEWIEKAQRARAERAPQGRISGGNVTERTASFVLARDCARQGRTDLAERLDREVLELQAAALPSNDPKQRPLRAAISCEIGNILMWRAMVECGELSVPRKELLAQFERIVRDFPDTDHRDQAGALLASLRTMVAEDEEHGRTAKPLAEMSKEEQVREWIFRLRDQNGKQWSQPGSCDVFNDLGGGLDDGKLQTPAHQLTYLGFAAVPALIETLGDKRPTRSVGYHRDFYFSHYVLTVGDCAHAVLERIAGRRFAGGRLDENHLEAARAEVNEWWRDAQARGEKQVLIDAVRSGTLHGLRQSRPLIAQDEGAALEALTAGIDAVKVGSLRVHYIRQIGLLQGDPATEVLRREMAQGRGLDARVAAGVELYRRGGKDITAAMIAEWDKWRPLQYGVWDASETADPLIAFLGTCGEPAAMQALARRFDSLPWRMKFQVTDVAGETDKVRTKVRGDDLPRAPETEVFAEDLLVKALADRTARYGMTGYRGGLFPRVCDAAASALAKRWPARYSFQWRPTRVERDPEITTVANTWRVAHGQAALPPEPRPVHPSAQDRPNVVAAIRWPGGGEIRGLPLAVGQELTTEALFETIDRLYHELPDGFAGFALSAERPGDRQGMVVEIQLEPGLRYSTDMWTLGAEVRIGDETAFNHGSGLAAEAGIRAESRKAESAASKALLSGPGEAVAIYFRSHVNRGP